MAMTHKSETEALLAAIDTSETSRLAFHHRHNALQKLRDNAELLARKVIALEGEVAKWRNHAEHLLSVIDSCDEAEAPSCEMEPEDVAYIDAIRLDLRAALNHQESSDDQG